jgi:hypothetical protein
MNYGLDPELLAQQPGLEAQDMLAQLLRKQAMQGVQSPEGQMISGHYVAPNILQHIAAAMQPGRQRDEASALEQATMKKRVMLQQALAQAQNQWMGEMPQGSPGMPAVAPVQGAPIERGGQTNPEATGMPGVAPQLPSALERMRWVAKGSQIPGNSPLAQSLAKMMGEETTREDNQQARRENLTMQMQAQLQQKQMEIAARLEQARMQGANAMQLAAMNIEGRREVAAMMAGFKQDRAEGADEDRLQRSTERLGKAAEAIAPLVVTGQAVQDMLDRYKGGKSIPGVGYEALLTPPLIKREANVNRATIQRFANAVARSEIGLSQTLSEQAQQALSNMSNGKFSEDEFKLAWPEILAKTNASINNLQGAYGQKVLERYNSQGGNIRSIASKAPVEPEDAQRKRLEELRAKAAAASSGATGGF